VYNVKAVVKACILLSGAGFFNVVHAYINVDHGTYYTQEQAYTASHAACVAAGPGGIQDEGKCFTEGTVSSSIQCVAPDQPFAKMWIEGSGSGTGYQPHEHQYHFCSPGPYCPDGYEDNPVSGLCEEIDVCQEREFEVISSGIYEIGTVSSSYSFATGCYDGCKVSFEGSSPKYEALVDGVKYYYAEGNYYINGFECSGQGDIQGTTTVPVDTCGPNQTMGTFNGETICVDEVSGESVNPTPQPDPTTRTIENETVDNGDGTSTTTTTETQPDGTTIITVRNYNNSTPDNYSETVTVDEDVQDEISLEELTLDAEKIGYGALKETIENIGSGESPGVSYEWDWSLDLQGCQNIDLNWRGMNQTIDYCQWYTPFRDNFLEWVLYIITAMSIYQIWFVSRPRAN